MFSINMTPLDTNCIDIFDVDVLLVHKTEHAILVKETEESEGKWLPYSQIEIQTIKSGIVPRLKYPLIKVSMPHWLAVEKGFV